MSRSKILSYDPMTQTKEVMHFSDDGRHVIESIQDCTDIVEQNALEAGFHNKKSDWWKVGSIPLTLCFQWAKESGTRPFSKEWQKVVKKKMNSSDYAKLNPNRIKI